MNERQRKILVDRVTKTFKAQIDELEAKIPDEPEMDKHVIASILNNSIKLKNAKEISEGIRKHVVGLKKGATFIEVEDEHDWRGNSHIKYRNISIKMSPFVIIDEPESYRIAVEKYQKIKKDIDTQIATLTDQFNTITLKIEVGSAKVLEPLVMQIDSLGSLDLISSTLIIGTTSDEKKAFELTFKLSN